MTLMLCACTSWRRAEVAPSTTLPPRRQVQLFLHDGRRLEWHGVRVTEDSVSGVPYLRPPECDSCRSQVARIDVDSARLGERKNTGFVIASVPFVALVGGVLARRLSGGD